MNFINKNIIKKINERIINKRKNEKNKLIFKIQILGFF